MDRDEEEKSLAETGRADCFKTSTTKESYLYFHLNACRLQKGTYQTSKEEGTTFTHCRIHTIRVNVFTEKGTQHEPAGSL